MELYLQRFFHGKDSTLGFMRVIDHGINYFTLEDQYQAEKVRGETRIPAGKYEIKFKETATPLTTKYREKFDWFVWHLELQNVKGFDSVYIHRGNYDSHTMGCLLVANSALLKPPKAGEESMIGDSTTAFKELYLKLKAALDRGQRVTVTIINR